MIKEPYISLCQFLKNVLEYKYTNQYEITKRLMQTNFELEHEFNHRSCHHLQRSNLKRKTQGLGLTPIHIYSSHRTIYSGAPHEFHECRCSLSCLPSHTRSPNTLLDLIKPRRNYYTTVCVIRAGFAVG